MSLVAIITEYQRGALTGKSYDGVSKFNPTKDGNGDYFISQEEIDQCTVKGFEFINDLELTEHIELTEDNI